MQPFRLSHLALICVCLAAGGCASPQAPLTAARQIDRPPKYGPAATPLSADHNYFRTHDAADFWALIPYYIGQQTDASCSVAVVATLINGLRASRNLTADDELATHANVIERVGDAGWTRGTAPGGTGVTLDELASIIERALPAFGIEGHRAAVHRVPDASEETIHTVRSILLANEHNRDDFLIANFLQSEFTGDPEGAVGHIAMVAAYDVGRDRVLILDPDRRWYEPYWVPVAVFVTGMATIDPDSQQPRGLVHVRPR